MASWSALQISRWWLGTSSKWGGGTMSPQVFLSQFWTLTYLPTTPCEQLTRWSWLDKGARLGAERRTSVRPLPQNRSEVVDKDRASQVALVLKNLPANAGDTQDLGLILESGRSPGGGHGNPLQYSCLENPIDRGAWQAMVRRVTKSRAWLKHLSTHACMDNNTAKRKYEHQRQGATEMGPKQGRSRTRAELTSGHRTPLPIAYWANHVRSSTMPGHWLLPVVSSSPLVLAVLL